MTTVRWRTPLTGLLTLVMVLAVAGAVPGDAQVDDGGEILSGFGSAPTLQPGADFDVGPDTPVVDMAGTPAGDGLWLTDVDGTIYRFGNAAFHGSMSGEALGEPIVGMAASPSGDGYWLVASDGGIFGFGDAGFHGSAGDIALNEPIVGMAASPSGDGYWLVAADGGIFGFGDAGFHGSAGWVNLAEPIVGMAASPSGDGYWLVAADGGVFGFGDAGFHGSAADGRLGGAEAVSIAAHPRAGGYWIAAGAGEAEAGPIRYEPDPGHVALTFDDGPHPTWTPTVLDILDDAGVAATFFVVGEEAERYPELLAEIVERGHSVQNHSHTHADLTELSSAAMEAELHQADEAIVAAGGSPPECYRPPYGAYNSRVSAVADRLGLEAILWDRDTRDWAEPGVAAIVDRATAATGGEIILLHDGSGDRRQTVSALPEIIDDLRAQGYGFQSLCVPGGSTTTTAE